MQQQEQPHSPSEVRVGVKPGGSQSHIAARDVFFFSLNVDKVFVGPLLPQFLTVLHASSHVQNVILESPGFFWPLTSVLQK